MGTFPTNQIDPLLDAACRVPWLSSACWTARQTTIVLHADNLGAAPLGAAFRRLAFRWDKKDRGMKVVAQEGIAVGGAPARASRTVAASPKARARFGDGPIYVVLALLVAGAWELSRLGHLRPTSSLGYWLGVAGGSMMLALFLYPLRKHVRFLRVLGPAKYWFVFHMVCGIGGPLVILVHCAFRFGSMNAAVALLSMLVVSSSGVVGRFLYAHIHRGLLGEKTTLRELQAAAGLQHDAVKSRFHFAPSVEQRLFAFEARALQSAPGWRGDLKHVVALPYQQWRTYRKCARELDAVVARLGLERSWHRGDMNDRRRRARKMLHAYLTSVVRVAQFSVYDRLFSLWHVLHIPFVFIMVVTAVVHVVAVHAY